LSGGPCPPFLTGEAEISDKIIFTGQEAQLLEESGDQNSRIARRAPIDSLLRYVAKAMPAPLPVLPPGTRWLAARKDLLFLVVEHLPQCRSLRGSWEKKGGDDYRTYRLAFPYILYLLSFYRGDLQEMKMFYRGSPLTSLDDPLYHTNLPNVRGEPGHYGSQRVCLRYRPEMLEGVPLVQSVPTLIDFFWSTGFNQDIKGSAFERAQTLDPRIASFEAWEAATQADSLFPLQIEWEQAGQTIPGLWLECLQLHGDTDQPINNAGELADILYRLPVGY
jgi:hypothetical protein